MSSNPTLSLSTTRVEGLRSLSVAGGGWSAIQSRLLVKEDPAPTTVGFDLCAVQRRRQGAGHRPENALALAWLGGRFPPSTPGTSEARMSDADQERGDVGVVCSLVERPDGKIRLVMDDAASPSAVFPQAWQVKTLFTWNDYRKDAFFNTEFSEKELADIGLSLVARLAALAAGRAR